LLKHLRTRKSSEIALRLNSSYSNHITILEYKQCLGYTEVMSVCTIQVRTYECDSYGHVNHANYINYLEYARYEFLKDVDFDYNAMLEAGYGVYIARVEIDYKRPAFTDDILTIESRPIKKGAVSGVIQQRITCAENVIVEAKVTWAFVNTEGTPVRMPKEWDVPGLYPPKA
jgi:acyl-CoA thioester hydrolase